MTKQELSIAVLRSMAYDAEKESRWSDAAEYLRRAIAIYPPPGRSALSALDLSKLHERLALAQRWLKAKAE